MRRSGPKPQPSEMKLLRGNPGRRRLSKHRVAPTAGATCPDWLSGDAKAEWERLAPELERLGILAQIDTMVLAAYCEAVSDLKWATETLEEEGLTQTAGNGTEIPHPAVAIKQNATKRVQDLAAEFGFSPAERGRVVFPGTDKDESDDKARFFGPRPAPAPPRESKAPA